MTAIVAIVMKKASAHSSKKGSTDITVRIKEKREDIEVNMKQVAINIPDRCEDCGFRKYVSGFNNNGPDSPDYIDCVIMGKAIAMESYLTLKEAQFDKITQKVTPAVCKWVMVRENEKKEWDGKAPDWCPGKEMGIPNAITLKNDLLDKYW